MSVTTLFIYLTCWNPSQVKDAGLLGGASHREFQNSGKKSALGAECEELTTDEVRAAFNGAQHDFCDYEVAEGEAPDDAEEMVFTEFIEALARIAISKWEGDGMDDAAKILMALEAVTALRKGLGDNLRSVPKVPPKLGKA
jgi:hypothetical protein